MKKTIYTELVIDDYIKTDTLIGDIMELNNIFTILKKEKKRLIDFHLKKMGDEWLPWKLHKEHERKHDDLKAELDIINKNIAMLEAARIIKEGDAFDLINSGQFGKN